MLVLSRRKGEEILVPGLGVAVKVVAVRGQTIRLGISAPPDVEVVRAEARVRTRRPNRRPPVHG